MTPGNGERTVQKLIFWLLGAIFMVMTAIGGATASHMISQNDVILDRISKIEAQLSADGVSEQDIERRLNNLEQNVFHPAH